VLLVMLVVLTTVQAQTPKSISGDWRAATVAPDGTPDAAFREFFIELKAEGASVTGKFTGAPIAIRNGRIEGNTVTLDAVNSDNNQPLTMTGNLTGDEIIFNVVGLLPDTFHVVARRITKVEIGGSVSDAALMQQLLTQFKVPGVSIAVIKDFKV